MKCPFVMSLSFFLLFFYFFIVYNFIFNDGEHPQHMDIFTFNPFVSCYKYDFSLTNRHVLVLTVTP
jgi:hypothetical protein